MTRISTGDVKVDTLIALARVAHIYDRHLEKRLSKYGINRTEYYLLDILKENNGTMKLSELKDWLQVARHTLTLVVNSLENKELIERNIYQGDRRSLEISIRPKGWECINLIVKDRLEIAHKLMSSISEEKADTLNKSLETLRTSLLKSN